MKATLPEKPSVIQPKSGSSEPPDAENPFVDEAERPIRLLEAENPFDLKDLEGLLDPEFDADPPRAESSSLSRKILLSPQMGIGVLIALACLYTLTRPCVIGECKEIDRARELAEKSRQTVETVPSSRAPGLAAKELNGAIALLKTIPWWSPYHREARGLLKDYREDEGELTSVVAALRMAGLAAEKSQNPPHEVAEWQEMERLWEDAIAQLQQVPANSLIYSFAEGRLAGYRSNLAEVRGRLELERQGDRTLEMAKKTAQIAQARQGVAKGAESWQLVYDTWQSAANTLASIPDGTIARQEGQLLLARYQPKLEEARDRKTIEQVGLEAYNRAVNNADQARIFEGRQAWIEASQSWARAVSFAEKVPQTSSYHVETQALLPTYKQAWQQAEVQANVESRVEKARSDLSRTCAGSPKVCNYGISRDLITVRLTPEYVEKIKTTAITGDRSGNPSPRDQAENHVQTLTIALQSISDNAKIPLQVYMPDGKKIASHFPN
jgi:hypothetical protein